MKKGCTASGRIFGANAYRKSQDALLVELDKIQACIELLRHEVPFARTRAEQGCFIEGLLIDKSQCILDSAHTIVSLTWKMEQNAQHLSPEES